MSNNLLQDAAWRGDAPIGSPPQDRPVGLSGRGEWPRMLVLDDDTDTRLKLWLDNELEDFFSERQPMLNQWKKWQTQYWAEPEQKERNFPFKKAANIVIPLGAIGVEAIHARMMNTLFSVEPFWSIRPRSKEWIPAAKPMESYLQAESENGKTLDTYGFCSESLLELIKLGTAVGKSGYKREFKKSVRRQPDGDEEDFFYESYNGATLQRVPLANFVMRFAETDPQSAPLVGEMHDFSWSQLKKMAQSGRMRGEAIEKIKHWYTDRQAPMDAGDGSEVKRHVQKLAEAEPLWSESFKIAELWVSFDIDGDGYDEEIVVDYHKPSRTFLSIRYNWYDDLHRPYRIGNYIEVEGVWTGIGVCKQTEQFQAQVTTIHRQRLDNATLANMSQLVVRKNSGYGPGEPIFPGKMWFLDDVNDIQPFKLSEPYNSIYANEEAVTRYYEKRTGANDIILGMGQQGTPATATSDLTRLAEGNKKFDLVLKNVRRWLSLLGQDIVTNYQIFGNQQVHWLTEGEDGAWVDMVLRMPSELVRRGAAIDLTITDSITNREVEQQKWMQLFQVITNYYQQVLQLSQLLQNPEIMAGIAQKALGASDEAMRRLLETFTVPDSDRFSLIEESPNEPAVRSTQPPQQGGTGRPNGASPPTGMAPIPAANGRNGGGPPPVGP